VEVVSVVHRVIPAVLAAMLTVVVVHPQTAIPIQHGDESIYQWKAAYFWGNLLRGRIPAGDGSYENPGFDPWHFWAIEQPFGSHLYYALVMLITGAKPPARPHDWFPNGAFQPKVLPDERIPDATIPRTGAVFAAAIGLSLIAWRFRWWGLAAVATFLHLPNVRYDLALAWAEGPMLLGFGLRALTYGTRYFPAACGLAASFKLTGLALWLLLLRRGSCGPGAMWGTAMLAPLMWTAVNPPAWFSLLGPLYLLAHTYFRLFTYVHQTTLFDDAFGLFLPSRYLLPFALLASLTFAASLSLIYRGLRYQDPAPPLRELPRFIWRVARG
jgi:hypothetical protein